MILADVFLYSLVLIMNVRVYSKLVHHIITSLLTEWIIQALSQFHLTLPNVLHPHLTLLRLF